MQSSRWQREAAVPEHVFETWLAKTREAGEELTSDGLRALAPVKEEDQDDEEDDDEEEEEEEDEDDDETDKYTRPWVLHFNVVTLLEVQDLTTKLAVVFGTTNKSDTVLASLREMARLKAQ